MGINVIDLSHDLHPAQACRVPRDQTWCLVCGRQSYLNTLTKMLALVPRPQAIELDAEAYHGIRMELIPCQIFDEESAIYVPAERLRRWNGRSLFGIAVQLVDREGMRVI